MTMFISEEKRLSVMRCSDKRTNYISYIGSLLQEHKMWNTPNVSSLENDAYEIVNNLLFDILRENQVCCDSEFGNVACIKCTELLASFDFILNEAISVYDDCLLERGFHWNPLGKKTHLSLSWSLDDMAKLLVLFKKEFFDNMQEEAKKDFSLQPEDM